MRESVEKQLLLHKTISEQDLSSTLGISRTAVFSHIKALQALGYGIDITPDQVYILTSLPSVLTTSAIIAQLTARELGQTCVVLQQSASTNSHIQGLAFEGAPHGTVVLTESQTAGKGRKGRDWISLPQSLAMSILLRPRILSKEAPRITILAAIAVYEALVNTTGITAGIKWPNDLQIDGKKLCGISLHMSGNADAINHIIIGIGVNCNTTVPSEAVSFATSLLEHGVTVNRNTLAAAILNHIECQLDKWEQLGFSAIMTQYRTLSVTLNKNVTVTGESGELTGFVQDFDDDGMLLLKQNNGIVKILSGDVSVRTI